jgi:hypothetical protein
VIQVIDSESAESPPSAPGRFFVVADSTQVFTRGYLAPAGALVGVGEEDFIEADSWVRNGYASEVFFEDPPPKKKKATPRPLAK